MNIKKILGSDKEPSNKFSSGTIIKVEGKDKTASSEMWISSFIKNVPVSKLI